MAAHDRRTFLSIGALGAVGVGSLAAGALLAACSGPAQQSPPPAPAPAPVPPAAPPRTLLIGCYTGDDGGRGITVGAWDAASGRIDVTGLVPVDNPSFLAYSPTRRVLYAVSEQEDGRVNSFALGDGVPPKPLNSQSSAGAGPTQLSVHPSGRYLLSANYDGGSVVVHPITADGGLGPHTDLVMHTGSGPDPERQEQPHPHQVLPDPKGGYVLATDLGTDSVYVYQLDLATGKLRLHNQLRLRPGSGPRHLAFHPDGEFAYLATELGGTVVSYRYGDGALTQLGELRASSSAVHNQPAEVVLAPDGRHLYVSNRGPDSISLFAVALDGTLTARGETPSGGKAPRFITMDPTGRFLFAANQDSNTLVSFTVNPADGSLTALPTPLHTPSPVCVLTG